MVMDLPQSEDGRGSLCGANKRQGEGTCRNAAGKGTDHLGTGSCRLHGGNTRSHEKHAQVVIARQEATRLGILIETDPGEALINAVWEAEGNLAFYRSKVQDLEDLTETETGPGGAHKTVESVYVRLYHEAEKWRATVAASALKAGVEARRLQIAEADSRFIFEGVLKALTAAGISDEQGETFRNVLAQHFRSQPSLTTR